MRIRGYLVDAASQINDYLARRASARRQWADHASHRGQASDSAITFDNVYAITSALADIRRLRESRLAIQNWIMALTDPWLNVGTFNCGSSVRLRYWKKVSCYEWQDQVS